MRTDNHHVIVLLTTVLQLTFLVWQVDSEHVASWHFAFGGLEPWFKLWWAGFVASWTHTNAKTFLDNLALVPKCLIGWHHNLVPNGVVPKCLVSEVSVKHHGCASFSATKPYTYTWRIQDGSGCVECGLKGQSSKPEIDPSATAVCLGECCKLPWWDPWHSYFSVIYCIYKNF